MTERRAHWDDDLIEAVRQAMRSNPWSVFAVIAAVEDGLEMHNVTLRRENFDLRTRNTTAILEAAGLRAQLQRVRDVCDQREDGYNPPQAFIHSIREALDGPQ